MPTQRQRLGARTSGCFFCCPRLRQAIARGHRGSPTESLHALLTTTSAREGPGYSCAWVTGHMSYAWLIPRHILSYPEVHSPTCSSNLDPTKLLFTAIATAIYQRLTALLRFGTLTLPACSWRSIARGNLRVCLRLLMIPSRSCCLSLVSCLIYSCFSAGTISSMQELFDQRDRCSLMLHVELDDTGLCALPPLVCRLVGYHARGGTTSRLQATTRMYRGSES